MIIFTIVATVLAFSIIPFVRFIERKEIKNITNEAILIELKEQTSNFKMGLFVLLGSVIIFLIKPTNVDIYTVIMKLMMIISIFSLEEVLKRKVFVTKNNILYVERLKNKTFTKILNITEKIYDIGLYKSKDGNYQIAYKGEDNFANIVVVATTKTEEAMLFKRVIKKQQNIQIEDGYHLKKIEKKTEESKLAKEIRRWENRRNALDHLTRFMIWGIFILTAYSLINTFENPREDISMVQQVLTTILAIQFIPFSLYIFSYFFLKTSGLAKVAKFISITTKDILMIFLLGSFSLQFYTLKNEVIIEGTRHVTITIIGMSIFAFLIITGWLAGILTKFFYLKKEK